MLSDEQKAYVKRHLGVPMVNGKLIHTMCNDCAKDIWYPEGGKYKNRCNGCAGLPAGSWEPVEIIGRRAGPVHEGGVCVRFPDGVERWVGEMDVRSPNGGWEAWRDDDSFLDDGGQSNG